jgi:LytS/YehU family sensor histidine kinase
MGFLFLSTVPLTNGLVAQIFGVRYIGTLFGILFFSHQVGSFLGVWAGGYLFEVTGSYLAGWTIAIVLGVVATLVHWPINDRPIVRNMVKASSA